MLILGRKIFPYLFRKIAKSQELLFLVSLAWVFSMVGLVDYIQKLTGIAFSIEVAGFLAGLALANSSEHFQIANRIKPLRDFFILMFFVILGSSIILYDFSGLGFPIIALSLFVLIGNPLIVMIIMGLGLKYRKRTSFMAGITVAQISEFSLILVTLGLKLGHLTEEIVGLVAAVGIVTITTSTYMVLYSDKIFSFLSPLLSLFEKKSTRDDIVFDDFSKPIILIGYDGTGRSIASMLSKEKLLIIDFNPDIIRELEEQGYFCFYGDVSDPLIFDNINFNEAEVVISTSSNIEDNINLVTGMKLIGKRGKIILRAQSGEDAKILYERGADYVFIPHYSSGQYLGKILSADPELKGLDELKKKDMAFINKINNKKLRCLIN
jgi:Trk K+ transport system NAD-binding subunit